MLNYMPLSVCKQQTELFMCALNIQHWKQFLITETGFFSAYGVEAEIKYESLFKVISMASENAHFIGIFIFWLMFYYLCGRVNRIYTF